MHIAEFLPFLNTVFVMVGALYVIFKARVDSERLGEVLSTVVKEIQNLQERMIKVETTCNLRHTNEASHV